MNDTGGIYVFDEGSQWGPSVDNGFKSYGMSIAPAKPSKGGKSNSRKTNRRKTNRRKTNRRR